MMTSDSPRKSKHPNRPKTKELLVVAGLTAAEYSSSYAVQDYLGKTIQNASCNPHASGDASKGSSKLQKPLKSEPKGEQTSLSKHPLASEHLEQQKQRNRAHRHTQVYAKALWTEHANTSRLSLVSEPSHHHQQRPAPVIVFQDMEEEKRQYAMFMDMQKITAQQAASKVDRNKLGRRDEALGSHPPFGPEVEVEDRSDETGSRTEVPSRSTDAEERGR